MKQTFKTVSGCPRTETEWNVRAAQKNCGAMCSDFSYHCLITKEMNATIEVCAEPKFIQGEYVFKMCDLKYDYHFACRLF